MGGEKIKSKDNLQNLSVSLNNNCIGNKKGEVEVYRNKLGN